MHSNLFQLLVDTGIVGLGTWLSIWITYFIETFKRRRLLTDENGIALGLLTGSLAAIPGFLTGGFFESSFYDSEVTMLLYFLMGLSLAKVKKAVKIEQILHHACSFECGSTLEYFTKKTVLPYRLCVGCLGGE